MTQKYNQGSNVLIMNGYQCYLKRMASLIPMEIRASQVLGYNLGLKLIRGAYMNEERDLASEQGKESPVWEDIEATHKCYNDNVSAVVKEMKEQDMLFVASHNADSCELAQSLAEERNMEHLNRVRFGQLKGFSDQLTGKIADEGY